MADWNDDENDLIVADYFAMLSSDLSGQRYNKAAHNRNLVERTGRPRASIEWKHRNISAVLKAVGQPWIIGYRPAFNLQASLIDAVLKWLESHPDWLAAKVKAPRLLDPRSLWLDPAPTLSNNPPPDELEQTQAVAVKFDVAKRDEQNRVLGRAGELHALEYERVSLASAGRSDLAKNVRWVSQEDGDGLGYDIASFMPDGRPRLVEVKTTNGWERTPFHISRNELEVSERLREDWRLLRIWNFARQPKAFELCPPLSAHVSLMPTSYLARFQ
ncbi:DUF3883 domain-containing protein [Maricaulis sp.]|uniref:DUF3883 domain-containing protein n=1 Tax=Maricaulis sp. TaxID=1486257 RepID=UPI000C3B6EAD|nr:DUF3883 domain-containing protein [Maricaulis sp.]MAC89748.1 hypothetical protein [Maricaulis sp.]